MKHAASFLTAGMLLLAVAAGQALAQHTSRDASAGFSSLARAPVRVGGPYLSVIQDRFGDPILVVDYPWTTHQRASVEVASLPDDPAFWPEVRPLYFFARFFKGETMVAIYKCQDAAAEVGAKGSFTEGNIDFELIGRRNSLGRPLAVVAASTPVEEAADASKTSDILKTPDVPKTPEAPQLPDASKTVRRAAFCLLEPCAVNRRLLQLDLPQTYFAKPGKIRVWFLRGDTLLWAEDVDWPGLAGQNPAK